MSWSIGTDVGRFDRHAADLDRLNDRLCASHPLLGSIFIGALVRHFATPGVLLATHCDAGATDGLVLLARRMPGIWQTFTPGQAPIAPTLMADSADPGDLLTGLPGLCLAVEWHCQDPICSCLVKTQPIAAAETVPHITTMNVVLSGPFDTYWAERSKNQRRNITRYLHRLRKEGISNRLEIFAKPDSVIDALGRYGDLESSGWKGQQHTAIHRDNIQGKFYADVLSGFAELGQARVYELYFDDELVASRLCVHNGRMLIILKTTYRETAARFAPGRLLLYRLLEREFAQREFRSIEFYTNATEDQLRWATGTRELFHMTQYRSVPAMQVLKASRAVARMMRRRATAAAIRP
ncbi:MAG: GNAT family N-acetyltransferase [Gammaproteobacteria bacterium]